MTLQDKFIDYFNGVDYISTKEIFEWYTLVKSGDNPNTYRASIYALVINPLLMKGVLKKVEKGIYTLTQSTECKDLTEEAVCQEQELDDFDKYIQEKIKGGM